MTQVDVFGTIVSPYHPVEIEPAVVQLDEALALNGQVVYVRLPSVFEVAYLDREVNRILQSRTDEADWVIVRCHPGVFASLSADVPRRSLFESRFPFAQVVLLHWNLVVGTHDVVNIGDLEPSAHAAEVLRVARALDFSVGLEQPGALLPANPEFHYEGPNGRHYDSFVRASYAFQSTDAMCGVGFWLLEHLVDADVLILDSWTMLGLGHVVASYASSIQADRRDLLVAAAEEYDEQAHFEERLLAIRGQRPGVRAVVVTSVHSTGATESRLIRACERAGLEPTRVVRLYSSVASADTSATVTLHELPAPVVSTERGACRPCLEQRKSLVPVDKRSLLLALTAAVEEARITRDLAADARGFFERYANAGALSVHRTDSSTGRHHMIYMDVGRLLEAPAFVETVIDRARDLQGGVDVVLSPSHSAAVSLATLLADELQVPLVVAEQGALSRLAGDDRANLFRARTILFVDDVSITGRRVRRVKSALMQAGLISDEREVTVKVFVGVARPQDREVWKGVVDYVGSENFVHAEYLELPNWSETECPWCLELTRLNDYFQHESGSAFLLARAARLRDVFAGLQRDILLSSRPDAGGRRSGATAIDRAAFNRQRLAYDARMPAGEFSFSALGQGSIFGRQSDLNLFISVASAIQKLRNTHKLSERSQYPLARVLNPHLYFLGRFYANVIVASLLRAARRRDVRTVDIEPILRKAVGDRLAERESQELHAELILAIADGKLPLPVEASDPAVLDGVDESVRPFLAWLLGRGTRETGAN
jgi:orotate phosphoribosyltransferase